MKQLPSWIKLRSKSSMLNQLSETHRIFLIIFRSFSLIIFRPLNGLQTLTDDSKSHASLQPHNANWSYFQTKEDACWWWCYSLSAIDNKPIEIERSSEWLMFHCFHCSRDRSVKIHLAHFSRTSDGVRLSRMRLQRSRITWRSNFNFSSFKWKNYYLDEKRNNG